MTALDAFLEKWTGSQGSERSHSQHFLIDLCDLVGLPRPGTNVTDDFRFEKDAELEDADGIHRGRADLVRRGAFVIECKQFTRKERASKAWNLGMQAALGQALSYARGLEEPPVFVIACDVGFCFELLACFDGSGHWAPFPSSANRIYLEQLREDPEKHARLAAALVDPRSLDPSQRQVEITKDVAAKIALLARELRAAGHPKEAVARFLMRCLFTMFAEDVGLFEGKKKIFEHYLREFWIEHPASFPSGASVLWQTMDTGGALITGERVHRFNGGLFREHEALPMTKEQLEVLLQAASRDWSQVEPAIFGTLLENALGDSERHALGAHFTPRAYVERLVRPTLDEPLRAEWLSVQTHVIALQKKGDDKGALTALKAFHATLCKVRVLDPACGTGNFLYVAMDLLKQLEAEVLEQIRRVGGSGQELLELDTVTVSPRSFLGIEKSPWAKEIAELVLWIGYLRWQWRLRGTTDIAKGGESILRDEKNIECRDALLDWDGAPHPKLALDSHGKPIERWSGRAGYAASERPDQMVPILQYEYPNARRAAWPPADFIVGNPPFVGTRRMRIVLGDGYVDALAATHDDVPDNADYVMYWWNMAADRVRDGRARAFGLITTNSVTQSFNRALVRRHLEADPPLSVGFAIPDHPWVDSEDGAAVRVAMTVGVAGPEQGRLYRVAREEPGTDGVVDAPLFSPQVGVITQDLRVGASPASAVPLRANKGLAYWGVKFYGDGFKVTAQQAADLASRSGGQLARPFVSGRDLTKRPRGGFVIDCDGIESGADLRDRFPGFFQHLVLHVKPERSKNPRKLKRERWWIFGENQPGMRRAVQGLERYVVTVETATYRVFTFLEQPMLAEGTICVIALDDAFALGVLSSRVHVAWALAAGGRLGVGNDPRYNKTLCFDPFPFPGESASQAARIRELGERIDAHRKRVLELHPKLTMTGMYGVLEKLRSGEPLSEKDEASHEAGLVSVLRSLHDELDAAVFDAYGWDPGLTDVQVLEKLVALNAERAVEEARGHVRYLRPDFQAPKTEVVRQPALGLDTERERPPSSLPPPPVVATRAWPKGGLARARAVQDAVRALPDGARFDAAALGAQFEGTSKGRAAEVATILDALAALGELITLAPGLYARPMRRTA